MIVTIDGPAGAGKSSIARLAAKQLQFAFLDTGAMYRCVTYAALRDGVDFTDTEGLLAVSRQAEIDFADGSVLLNGRDVGDVIRMPEVTRHIRFVADHPGIRDCLNEQQRRIARGKNIVTEGRDQGSEVFPHAECKIFLTASPEERAARRQQQLRAAGETVTIAEVLADQNQRDLEDRLRAVGSLRPAPDAIILNTDGMQPQEVLQRVLDLVQANTETA